MNNNTIANKLKEYHQTFLKLGINNYFSYNDDNNEMKAFEPLCNYFGCKPIYDWNDLYHSKFALNSIKIYDDCCLITIFIDHYKSNKQKAIDFPSDENSENIADSLFETLDRIIANVRKQVEMTDNISTNDLFDIAETILKEKCPKSWMIKKIIGKTSKDNDKYNAILVSSSDRIIDQIGHFICNKGENGILSLVWSAPLCGETEYQCKTLDEFKNAVREFNLN